MSSEARSFAPHPAPHRYEVHPLALIFGLLAAPLAWSANLIIKYGLASYACFPGQSPLKTPSTQFGWVASVLPLIDVVAFAISLAAIWISFRSLQQVKREMAGNVDALAEIGEGRTRFLALWGMWIGLLFALAIVFSFVADVGLRLCA